MFTEALFTIGKTWRHYKQNLVRDLILEMRERELKITEHRNSTPEPQKTKTEKDTCIPLFTAALFTIARIWKQPRCP